MRAVQSWSWLSVFGSVANSLILLFCMRAEANFQSESLEDLMNSEVQIASPIASSVRLAPGVVSIFDRSAIEASGATTLQEFIGLVPGFQIASDTAQTIGLGFRGLWGHEGKILVLVDGFEFNDLAYNTFLIGDRIPLSLIEKIEVVRGAGSVVHGGNAELAVISITTMANSGEPQAKFYSSIGSMTKSSQSRGTIALGARFPRAISDSGTAIETGVVAYGIQSTTSDKTYTSLGGESADLKDAALFAPRGALAHFRWQDWKSRLVFEDLETRQVANYGTPAEPPVLIRHRQFQLALGREWGFDSNQFKISANYNHQTPWNSTDLQTVSNGSYYDKSYRRIDASFEGSYFSGPHRVIYGIKHRDDLGKILSDGGSTSYQFFGNSNPTSELQQSWTSVFSEYAHVSDDSLVVIGVRHEIPSRVESSTVPRLSYARTFESTTLKLMASAAFRTPGSENLSLNQRIRPERTQTYELEMIEVWSPNTLSSVNLFSTSIADPIVYTNVASAGGTADQYRNFGRTGSTGAELNLHWQSEKLRAQVSLAYANSDGMNDVSQYTAKDGRQLLGFSAVRATGYVQSTLGALKLSTNATWESSRQGWAWNPVSSTSEVLEFEPTLMLGVQARYQVEDVPGLVLGIAGSNLLNQERPYLLPYKGETSTLGPMPGPSREWTISADYIVGF